MPRLLVFSDLDGTLLDHTTYSYAPARPALAALRARDALLILASSKTAAEMLPLHQELDLGEAPMIVENGAACLPRQRLTVVIRSTVNYALCCPLSTRRSRDLAICQ